MKIFLQKGMRNKLLSIIQNLCYFNTRLRIRKWHKFGIINCYPKRRHGSYITKYRLLMWIQRLRNKGKKKQYDISREVLGCHHIHVVKFWNRLGLPMLERYSPRTLRWACGDFNNVPIINNLDITNFSPSSQKLSSCLKIDTINSIQKLHYEIKMNSECLFQSLKRHK